MSHLSELAVSKRSVTLLLAAALFIAGISPGTDFSRSSYPTSTSRSSPSWRHFRRIGDRRASQVAEPIERAIKGVPRLEKLQSTSANSIALLVAQFSFGTDVKETQATIEENIASAGLPASVRPDVSALNINASPVVIASIAATDPDGLEAAANIARTEIVPDILRIEASRARPHRRARAAVHHPRPRQARPNGHHDRPDQSACCRPTT
jgi:multidrug efflux pump subunit AcrB